MKKVLHEVAREKCKKLYMFVPLDLVPLTRGVTVHLPGKRCEKGNVEAKDRGRSDVTRLLKTSSHKS